MKYITLIALLFAGPAFAKSISQDGVDYSCSPKATCEEKLRYSKKEVVALKKQLAAKPTVQEKVVYKERVVRYNTTTIKHVQRKNRLSILLGYGPTGGLRYDTTPTRSVVESQSGGMLGAQYQRLVTERVSLGVGGFANGLVFVGAGYDF